MRKPINAIESHATKLVRAKCLLREYVTRNLFVLKIFDSDLSVAAKLER